MDTVIGLARASRVVKEQKEQGSGEGDFERERENSGSLLSISKIPHALGRQAPHYPPEPDLELLQDTAAASVAPPQAFQHALLEQQQPNRPLPALLRKVWEVRPRSAAEPRGPFSSISHAAAS